MVLCKVTILSLAFLRVSLLGAWLASRWSGLGLVLSRSLVLSLGLVLSLVLSLGPHAVPHLAPKFATRKPLSKEIINLFIYFFFKDT